MGVSFKISRAGQRFIPKPIASSSSANTTFEEEEEEEEKKNNKNESTKLQSAAPLSTSNLKVNVTSMDIEEDEVSFTLLLFPDGYSIGRPSENRPSYQAMLQDAPKFLHPYDRASEALFSAIECGRLPGDILDDIPCKYVNGTVVCEVRDYRNCSSDDGPPVTNKVCLKMSLENIVKDIPMLSNDTWTYGDLMEVEARIVKTLQPQLCLDPSPKLDRLCENPVQKKLNLDIRSLRRKRREEMAGVIVTSSNELHGKKVSIDRVPESSGDAGPISGNIMPQHVHDNAHVMGSNNASLSSLPFVSQQSKYQMGYADGMNLSVSSVHARRENQDDPLSPASNLSKRAKLTSLGPDGNQQQHMGAPMDSLQGSDLQWKNSLLQQQQYVGGFQYANNGLQKLPQQIYEGGLTNENSEFIKARATTQQGIRFPKEEPVESDKSELYQNRNESLMVDAERNRMQQRLPPQHAFMRSNFTQPPWNTFGHPMENNLQKKKSVPSPRGGLPSPLSSKSQEISSSSVGPQFGPVGVVSSHKDKTQATSVPTVGGATSLTSSANDNSMQRQQQVQLAAKRRSNSHPKTSTMSGVGSPASVSNMSPADEMLPQADPKMIEIFLKVDQAVTSQKKKIKQNKVDEKQMRKPAIYRPQQIMIHLSGDSSGESFIDDSENKELAKSLVGGSMNACKIRVLTFVQNERIMQGNGFALVPKSRIRMILSANPSEGTIAMHYGDMLESESIFSEENLPTLPNAHLADILAAQLSSLMAHDGYEIEDKIHPKPVRANHAQQNTSNNNAEQFSDVNTGQQQYNEVARPNNSVNSPLTPNQNLHSPRMLPPQNLHALQMSQGFGSGPARPQQNEPQSLSQQQPNQFQRSQVMLPSNQLSQANPLGQNTNPLLANNQMIYKQSQSHLQMQLMQQQQQQQQPQRKMMMGMGANMGNNVVGLGGLSNVMGMRAPTMSGPMGSISGLGQNPMNLSGSSNISNQISQQIRNGQLTTQALMTAKLRMANRGMMGGGAQTNLGGISGAKQMHPSSSGIPMLGHSLNNRGMGPMNPMQRSGVGPMGPPKLMTGMNSYMNLQLQQQQQQQMQFQTQQIQQQQQFQQQQLQQQQQQQDSASPLQAVVSSPQQLNQQSQQQQLQQASPQQMSQLTPMSPQHMSQRTPMSPQLSSGINMSNVEAVPASPQLSSQTLGSVGNIANSPMEQLQGSNKNNDMHS